MNNKFNPDYRRLVNSALNRKNKGFPLYEHNISYQVAGKIIGEDLEGMFNRGDREELKKMFSLLAGFYKDHGYDGYSFEGCTTRLIQGGKGLTGQAGAIIKTREDFEDYPWAELPERYFNLFSPYFDAIRDTLPDGMKIVGGVGNGVFETIQDFVPFTELSYLEVDDPALFAVLWQQVGETLLSLWTRFLEEYADILAIGRFGDDLGFKSAPLMRPDTVSTHILPQYKKIVDAVHGAGVPFLLHSCGCIFDLMDEIIETTGIDAKHSNEDNIAPFSRWVEDYGDRIGNFGGFDMDFICRSTEDEIRSYVRGICEPLCEAPGIAFGSGNQIADYVPPGNFQAMVDELRQIRGY
ncbi:MAG: uroporphyrinogen decarboxylase family protein [Spirochaetales bacterium]|nr:uroporphyrinogen decarboxylase family protein [Spirochaetales bacterium]